MIEIIKGTWAAGETKTFHINGQYLELLDAQYPCDVFLMNNVGAQLSVMRDCEASFFSKPSGGFATVQITSAQAQFLRFFVGSGDAGTRRISSTVQVVDGGLRRTLAGAAFMVNGSVNGGAGTATVQLWNPVGSGKNLILKGVVVGASVSGGCNFASGVVQAATLQFAAFSKLMGGAIGVGQVRVQGPDAVAIGNAQDSVYLQGVVSIQRTFSEPVVIPPGQSYNAQAGATVLGCTFEWTEEAV